MAVVQVVTAQAVKAAVLAAATEMVGPKVLQTVPTYPKHEPAAPEMLQFAPPAQPSPRSMQQSTCSERAQYRKWLPGRRRH